MGKRAKNSDNYNNGAKLRKIDDKDKKRDKIEKHRRKIDEIETKWRKWLGNDAEIEQKSGEIGEIGK